MTDSNNPYLPKAREDAVRLAKLHGWSQAKAARYMGVNRATIRH